MKCTRKITNEVSWIGGDDHRISLFENLFPLQHGVSYNAYAIMDEKTAIIDTVDASIAKLFFENVKSILNGRTLDYLIINHMEPDHCSQIEDLLLRYPNLTLVGNVQTFKMMKQFFDFDKDHHAMIVKEGDVLDLGKHQLSFYMTPMVHWPEVMVTYDAHDKILFSADAFGTFRSLDGNLFADETRFNKYYLDEARRYYANIVGKFGTQVQAAIKKLSSLDIQMICPLHGPLYKDDFSFILNKYDLWSQYQYEEKSVILIYGSMYGNTENAVHLLANELSDAGVKDVTIYDVSKTDVSYLISEIFRVSHIVLASSTYNLGIYPKMHQLLEDMKALNIQNKTIGLIDNGTWAPTCVKQMRELILSLKNICLLDTDVIIKSSLKEDSYQQLLQLKTKIIESMEMEKS